MKKIFNMDGKNTPPKKPIINPGMLRDFIARCLLCLVTVWNLCFKNCQESGEEEPSENYLKDKFSQERGEYLKKFCLIRTLQERKFKLQQLIYRFFYGGNSEQKRQEAQREPQAETCPAVQNETGVIHDMGLRLRIRKGEQGPVADRRPSTGFVVDRSQGAEPVCDHAATRPEAGGLSQGTITPAASSAGAAGLQSPPSTGTCIMPTCKESPDLTTLPLPPINNFATSALVVTEPKNTPSPPLQTLSSQPSSDSSSSFSSMAQAPQSNTLVHQDSHAGSATTMFTESEGISGEDPPSQTTTPRDDTGLSAILPSNHSRHEKTSETPAPRPVDSEGLKEEAGAVGIYTEDSCSDPDTKLKRFKSNGAVRKKTLEQGPTPAWKESPGSGTLAQMSLVVAAQAEVQIPRTKDEEDPKPGGPESLQKASASRLQTSTSDRSSPAVLTPWTPEARETDKDVNQPKTSASSSSAADGTCAESELPSSSASEAGSSQVGLLSETLEEVKAHSKAESSTSDTED
ncbi:uncharacterized protein [Haliotis cracherodii]|uniref:uncharacterized protein n=1 Tax=Haliotis cracherodii TaxID=6455 RepID=UPI0039ED6415